MDIRYGDLIENGWASRDNPKRFGYFSETVTRGGKVNRGTYMRLTDKKGKFWECPRKDPRFLSKVTNHGQVSIESLPSSPSD